MLYKSANANTFDFIAMIVHCANGEGSFTKALPVCYIVDGNSANGISADHPDGTNNTAFAGIMRTSVAIDGYGYATSWGHANSVQISGEGSSVTITAGDVLQLVSGTGLGMSSGAGLGYTTNKYAIQTVTPSGAGVLNAYSQAVLYADDPIIRAL